MRKLIAAFVTPTRCILSYVVAPIRLRLRFCAISPLEAPHNICNILNSFRKTSFKFRPFSHHVSGTVFDSSPNSTYQASKDLEGLQWPEESLTSTSNENGGFYPARLGETFDDGRFVITRKLGWGGYSSVWLARDRKYVLESTSLYPQFIGKIKR